MLTLRRKEQESFVIALADGTEITVAVLDIRGDTIRIGIDAPRHIVIHRSEVWRWVRDEWLREQEELKNER
jgi:carbon storage regulator